MITGQREQNVLHKSSAVGHQQKPALVELRSVATEKLR